MNVTRLYLLFSFRADDYLWYSRASSDYKKGVLGVICAL